MLTVRSLGELAQVRKTLVQRAEAAAQEAARQKEEAARAHARKHLFRLTVGKVQPLKAAPVADLRPRPAPPIPFQRALDEAAALREALSDEVDISTLLDTDEHLSFRRRGVGADVTQRLRKGQWAVQAQIDLHGLRTDEARETLGRFVHDCHAQGLRCVRVVHGKGLGSPGKTPVLKDKTRRWLVQKSEVVAFVQSPPSHGGAGALLVLLQPVKAKHQAKAEPSSKIGL
ncbi:MAG: DNA mismatch repair protein MutS [Rhodoferax sp.]|nr:MAG: DNA mismatch repair protein MutS [Rhodoferax sp.]